MKEGSSAGLSSATLHGGKITPALHTRVGHSWERIARSLNTFAISAAKA